MKHSQTDETIRIAEPSDDDWESKEAIIPEKGAKIAKYFVNASDKALYEYDFEDCWEHEIVLEQIVPAQANVEYPRCTAGKRACPPEDCGGVFGYEQLLKILADPNDAEYKEKMEWLKMIEREGFNPDEFDVDEIFFQNPTDRLNLININAARMKQKVFELLNKR